MSNCPTLNDGPGMEQISSGPVDFVARCVQARAIERDINRDRERERERDGENMRDKSNNTYTHIPQRRRDTETRRHADMQTCRHTDTQTHRYRRRHRRRRSHRLRCKLRHRPRHRHREREREGEVLGELLRRVSCEEPDSTCLPLNGIVISLLYYTCFALVQLQTCEGI